MLRQDKINKLMGKNTGSKILVIDDSTTNNLLLEAILKREGYHVFTAFSVEEALKQLYKELSDTVDPSRTASGSPASGRQYVITVD